MADVPGTGCLRIERDRHFEDYRSLKQYYRGSICNEILYAGHQLTTAAAVELQGSEATFAVPAANGYVYAKSEADLAALDGDSIYFDYVDSDGVIYEGCEAMLDDQIGTDEEVPYGFVAGATYGTRHDTVASVAGDTITMTNLNSSSANDLAGLTVLGLTGDQAGATLIIASNTAASPTVITCTTTPNANWAADTVCIGTFPATFYRLRQMYLETESPTDNKQYLCDIDGSNLYGIVSDGGSRANFSRYFVPVSYNANSAHLITHAYLGKIHASFPNVQADAEIEGAFIQVTFTPFQINANEIGGAPSDVVLKFYVQGEFTWEPCIRLEPKTDVIIQIGKTLNADHAQMFVETAILEVTNI